MQSVSVEDYLRVMYEMNRDDDDIGISSVAIAHELEISKPSVSAMIRKLKDKGYVRAEPYSKVFLTKKGMQEGYRIFNRHLAIERFLKEILNYCEGEAHDEAHRLEHAFSEESIRRLSEFLDMNKR